MNPKLSFIIPVFNEQENLPNLLDLIAKFDHSEFIFVDGGSTDKSVEIIDGYSKQNIKSIKIISTEKSRSVQMNAGAGEASGNLYIFLHADTKIPESAIKTLTDFVDCGKSVVGSFKFKIDAPDFKYRILEQLVEIRNYLFDLPYGDQAFFVSKKLWMEYGSFKEIPIMEDVEWIRRVGKKNDLILLPFFAETDGRRWKRLGFFKNSMRNMYLQFRFFKGDDPVLLHEIYYDKVG